MKIAFDIIIVSFNAGQKLLQTLQSVLDQDGITGRDTMDVRVIIKDGGSVDGCIEAAQRFLHTCPQPVRDRVQILCDADEGIYDAMNIALDACLGSAGHTAITATEGVQRYVYFINCGDRLAGKTILNTVADRILADEASLPERDRRPAI